MVPVAHLNIVAEINVNVLDRSPDVRNQLKVKEMSFMDAVGAARRPLEGVTALTAARR